MLRNLLWIMLTATLWANTPDHPAVRQRIEAGIEQTIRNDFTGAEATFRQLAERYPDAAFPYFYVGATIQAAMLDAEDYRRLDEFRYFMDLSIKKAEILREQNAADLWSQFIEGSAYMYISFMDSKTSKMWGAYRNAVKGVDRLEKVIAQDSTFYDAYLGVGSYKYWKSRKTRGLAWLPFMSDDREQGIAMIREAIDKGRLVPLVARDQLAWIWLDDGNTAAALQLAEANMAHYPESRFFRWTLVEICYRSEQYERAAALYDSLLTELQTMPENNHYNEITCLLRLAEICHARGDMAGVIRYADRLLRLSLDEEVRKRSRKKRERALALRTESQKALQKTSELSSE